MMVETALHWYAHTEDACVLVAQWNYVIIKLESGGALFLRTSISRNYAKTCIDKTIHQKYTPLPSHPPHLQMSCWDIFSMACTDGGKTGRSLSTVSKRICELSKVFKYQTLQVKRHQLRPLARVLRSLPLDARRVVHLLILPPNSGQPFFVNHHHDRFLDIDKNRVLALVAHSLHTLELTGNYA